MPVLNPAAILLLLSDLTDTNLRLLEENRVLRERVMELETPNDRTGSAHAGDIGVDDLAERTAVAGLSGASGNGASTTASKPSVPGP